MEYDWKRFAVAFGANIFLRHIDDDKFWSDILRKTLKPQLDQIDPLLMVQSFQENYDFKKMLEPDHIKSIYEITEGNEDLLVKLKQRSKLKMVSFSWKWIEEWWQKDHKDLLAIVENHPDRERFRNYIVKGVKELAEKFQNSF